MQNLNIENKIIKKTINVKVKKAFLSFFLTKILIANIFKNIDLIYKNRIFKEFKKYNQNKSSNNSLTNLANSKLFWQL